MKSILKLFLVGLVCLTAKADILRLRDGRMITGSFLGATRTEIWFQRDTPGDVISTGAYPIEQVESLTFGPAVRQASAGLIGKHADMVVPDFHVAARDVIGLRLAQKGDRQRARAELA